MQIWETWQMSQQRVMRKVWNLCISRFNRRYWDKWFHDSLSLSRLKKRKEIQFLNNKTFFIEFHESLSCSESLQGFCIVFVVMSHHILPKTKTKLTQGNDKRETEILPRNFTSWSRKSFSWIGKLPQNFPYKVSLRSRTALWVSSIFPLEKEKSFDCILLQRVVALVSTRS